MNIYCDHNATTPLDPRVLESMLPYLKEHWGNASSVHGQGRVARAAVEKARAQVAALVQVQPDQIIFTSGGTEANNLALKGAAARIAWGAPTELGLAVSAVEHASVLNPAHALATAGWTLDTLPVDAQGRVLSPLLSTRRPALVSVMLANNETGVIQDVARIATLVRQWDGIVHTDAVQAAGKIDIDFNALGVHLMTLSAHKIYGPKGVGALVIDKAVDIEPLLQGGGHEAGLRAGTENVAGIVGFGVAAELARAELAARTQASQALRVRLEHQLMALNGITLFGTAAPRVANTLMFAVTGIAGETLVLNLDQRGIAVSSGSACASGEQEPSHVLLAMGVDRDLAHCAIRVSLGTNNTPADIDAVTTAIAQELLMVKSIQWRAQA